jgi:succinate dehydrogenase / fumarate reductase flavoprotein subunit
VPPRACPSPASTAACSTTAPSAARRSRAPSTPAARPASSCCSAPTSARPPDRPRQRQAAQPHRDARRGRGRRPAAGIVTRDLRHRRGHRRTAAHAVVLATGGYGNVFFLSTNAMAATSPRSWRAHKQGRGLRQPLLHADPPHLHPPESGDYQSKLTLMSESLRNDGRIWVPKNAGRYPPPPAQIPERARLLPRARYPSFGNLAPRDIASRRQEVVVDEGAASARQERRLPRLRRRHRRLGEGHHREERYGNLFEMYERITGESLQAPMRIYPAVHYTMGGLWVDYELMTTVPGLYAAGEANFSDHGANRLGASALMQGLADGYFVLPVHHRQLPTPARHQAGAHRPPRVQGGRGRGRRPASTSSSPSAAPARPTPSTASSARSCGTTAAWSARKEGLEKALAEIPALREEFRKDVRVTGSGESQPVAGEGRPGRRLLRAGRAHVPRRPHP